MSTIKIKTLSSQPVYTYDDTFNLDEVVQVGFESDNSDTSKMWGHVYDDLKTNRTIQSIHYNLFEISSILAQNIKINLLTGANHVYIETSNYGNFYATNIEIEKEDTNSRDSKYKIKFKQQLSLNYELNSNFAETLHANLPVNVLNYTVQNPSYSFQGEILTEASQWRLKTPRTDLMQNVVAGEYYYIHNVGINENDCYYCLCVGYDSVGTVFQLIDYTGGAVTLTEVVIDNEVDVTSQVLVIDKDIELNLYTFINPIYPDDYQGNEGIETDQGVKENQSINNKNVVQFKVWVSTSEKYKIEYLRYALKEDILLTLTDGTIIMPSQVQEIAIIEEKDTLLECYEYNIMIKYNNKVVNIYR